MPKITQERLAGHLNRAKDRAVVTLTQLCKAGGKLEGLSAKEEAKLLQIRLKAAVRLADIGFPRRRRSPEARDDEEETDAIYHELEALPDYAARAERVHEMMIEGTFTQDFADQVLAAYRRREAKEEAEQ
jgi:hypothetical protein